MDSFTVFSRFSLLLSMMALCISTAFADDLNNSSTDFDLLAKSLKVVPNQNYIPKLGTIPQTTKSKNKLAADYKFAFVNDLNPSWSSIYFDALDVNFFKDKILNTDYSTFVGGDVTAYDVVILVVGDGGHLSDGSPAIIETIDKIIKAGKNLILCTDDALSYEFYPGYGTPDERVRTFFSDTMGIKYKGIASTGIIYPYLGWYIHGASGDIVGMSTRKAYNLGFGTKGDVIHYPLGYVSAIEYFRTKDAGLFPVVDRMAIMNNDFVPIDRDSCVGIRTTSQSGSRIVFWCMPFAPFAEDGSRQIMMQNAMYWLADKSQKQGPTIEFDNNSVRFRSVAIDSSKTVAFQVINRGVGTLHVSKIEIDNSWTSDNNTYTLDPDVPPFDLPENEAFPMYIKFKPKTEGEQLGFLIMESDATNATTVSVDLLGYGGFGSGSGPVCILDMKSMDFGQVKESYSKTLPLKITNKGQSELIIDILRLKDTTNCFTFAKSVATPFSVDTGKNFLCNIKFVPLKNNTTYYATLILETNADSAEHLEIPLVGKGLITAVEEAQSDDGLLRFKVSPAPVGDILGLDYNWFGSETLDLELSVVDINGEKVLNWSNQTISSRSGRFELPCSNLTSGAYFITIKSKNQNIRIPVLISN